ncbi:MAG: hypothetical protein ABTQ73_01310 [Caldilineales bacterium]
MRFFRIIAFTLILSLLLSACGAATMPTTDETTASGQRFLVSLPRLILDIDQSGRASVNGLSIETVNSLIPGAQLPDMGVNPVYVDWMTNTNVQHLEFVSSNKGIFIFANGQPLPYLTWDGDSLANLGTLAGIANLPYGELIGKLVPIVERTGLNIVLRFPMQTGASEIAMRDPAVAPEVLEPETKSGDPSFVVRIDVNYDEQGIPTVAGISSRDLAAAGIFLPVELTPDTLAQFKANNVNELRFVSGSNGVFATVNGEALPQIGWNSALLDNSANLYAQINPDSPYINLANLLLPELSNLDVDLRITMQ